MVVNPRFVVGISLLPVTVSEIYMFLVLWPFPVVGHYWNRPGTLFSSSPWLCCLNFDDICHTFGDKILPVWRPYVAIPGYRSYSKLLCLRSLWSILEGSQLKRNKFDVSLCKRLEDFYPQAHQVCVNRSVLHRGGSQGQGGRPNEKCGPQCPPFWPSLPRLSLK